MVVAAAVHVSWCESVIIFYKHMYVRSGKKISAGRRRLGEGGSEEWG